jgi:exonuclease III
MRFGTCNVRSLYKAGSLKTVARELGKYKLDLVGVQEVRLEKEGTERAEDYTFLYGKGNDVGGTCGTLRRGEECVQGFDEKARRKDTTWKTKA